MVKKIVSAILSLAFITPLFNSKLTQESKPKKIDSIEILNLKDYKLKEVEDKLKVEIEKLKEIEAKKLEEEKQRELEQQKIEESKKQYWKFEVSYYCGCYHCTQNGNLITASGEYAQEGVTIALPSDIPFGTKVHVDNVGDFVVQDRGGYIAYTYDENGDLIMRADVYISDHNRALQLGRHIESGYIKIN